MNRFHRFVVGGALSLLPALALMGSPGDVSGKYWFDNHTTTYPLSPGNSEIDVSSLNPGIHTFNALFEQDGQFTVASSWFYQQELLDAQKCYYWFDMSSKTHDFNPGALSISTDGLSEGLHCLHVAVGDNHTVTNVESAFFMKSFTVLPGMNYTTHIYIDGLLYNSQNSIAGAEGMLSLNIDMNNLPLGTHLLMAEVFSPSGVPTALSQAAFVRVPTDIQLDNLSTYYLIDGLPAGDVKPLRKGDTYTLDLNLSKLPSGIHSVSAFLASADGLSTSMPTAWFVKIPIGGEGVVRYEYWLNDNYSKAKEVVLDKVANPLSIISLEEMEQEPFCSSRYSFAIENGKPVVYGCNDYQIRFCDPDGRFTQGSGRYTDVRVKKEVEPCGAIPENLRTRVRNLSDNEIRWYTFQGEIGDSIGVSLDRGAMYELYSPTGEKVISANGAEAVSYKAKTLFEKGTYYLALHDVTSYGDKSQLEISFTRIPRFAVLSFTPEESSDEDLLIMNIHGNGFDSMQSMLLRNASGTIEPSEISHIDNHDCLAIFRFDDKKAERGDYTIEAVFTDKGSGENETVLSSKKLKITEGSAVDIAVSVNAPFIARTPYQVNIIVENRSNRGHYGIPLNIAVKDFTPGGSVEMIDFALARSNEKPESPFYHSDNLLGTGEPGVFLPTIIPYLAPYERKVYTIGYVTKPMETLTMYAWAGSPWSEDAKIIMSRELTNEELAELTDHNYFSLFDVMDIYASVMNGETEMDYANRLKNRAILKAPPPPNLRDARDAAISAGKASVYAGGAVGSWAMNQRLSHSQAVLQACGYTMGDDMYQDSGLADWDNMNRGMLNVANDLMEAGSTSDNLIGHAQSLNHLCNARNHYHQAIRKPRTTPSHVTSYQSGDPNDIHGYEAPSGSRYIGLAVKDVTYTIEFENDPEIANAPASRIVVENYIDKESFDPATLVPRSMRLSNKEIELPAEHHFIRTLDMRPEIGAIAELSFDYDAETGHAVWNLRSLDPLTMDETIYMDSGILPVNNDSGRGIGYLTYTIGLRDGLKDGRTIKNMATIVFDDNKPIDTPEWENTLDYVCPEAKVESITTEDKRIYTITVDGSDTGSGIWFYDLYVRPAGQEKWSMIVSQSESNRIVYESPEILENPEFAVIATDYAANRQNESFMTTLLGDADGNGKVDTNDVVIMVNYYINSSNTTINLINADVNKDGHVDTQDVLGTINIYLDQSHQKQFKPTRKYKK